MITTKIKLNDAKAEFKRDSVIFMGHEITTEGIVVDENKVQREDDLGDADTDGCSRGGDVSVTWGSILQGSFQTCQTNWNQYGH